MEDNNTPAPQMQLTAQKAQLHLDGARELLSAGMAGVVQVRFTCSEDWDGLRKIAVFSNGAVSVDVPESEWDDGVCTVPREVLERAGKTVLAGLYGTDGENVILPTVWCSLGRVEAGAVPACQLAAPANAPLWAQLLGRIEALEAQPASGYQMPEGGIPASDLSAALQTAINAIAGKYAKPSGGIPESDLESPVQAALMKADTAYQKPSGGITWEDLQSSIVASLGLADTAYQKPQNGIPLSDLSAAAKTALGRSVIELESFHGSDSRFTMSMSMSDICDAYEAGGDVFIQYEDPYTHELADCRLVRIDGFDSAVFAGCRIDVNSDEMTAIVFTAMNNIADKYEIALSSCASPASSVAIADTAGYYTSGNVEGALAEIGAQLDGLADALSNINDVLEGAL